MENIKSKKITELNHVDAKKFFLDEKNYVNFDIPDYFHFEDLLLKIDGLTFCKNIKDICNKRGETNKPDWPKYYENVNYTFLSNKDGVFAWRPMQLIHPVLYVDFVNFITSKDNWDHIVGRFEFFSKGCVRCISIPRMSQCDNSHKAAQIMHWWEEMEQQSIILALKYNYVFSTDITNCYGSIYTHSVEWALTIGGREASKKRVNECLPKTLGSEVDEKLRNMSHGQTNGISQGSTLMDFVAEMVLGYCDMELLKEISDLKIKKKDLYILRYRDDYRIFVNDPLLGHQVLKKLNNVLYGLGMKMNPSKTIERGDVILSSIKGEKLERIFLAPIKQDFQKEALRIYQLSKKYPNSGLIAKELSLYYDRMENLKSLKHTNIKVLISIFSMIALNSPSVINWVSAIVSSLLEKICDGVEKKDIILMIYNKFQEMPNTSLIDVWLQRITAPLKIKISYFDNLTKIALQEIKNSDIWESRWLNSKIVQEMDLITISKLKKKVEDDSISPVISRAEVQLFRLNYLD